MAGDEGRDLQEADRRKSERQFREALGAALAESGREPRPACYWLVAIVLLIGFVIPLAQFAGIEFLLFPNQRQVFYDVIYAPYENASRAEQIRVWLILTTLIDWPFLVYAVVAARWIKKGSPAFPVPVAYGLIGLCVPYLFFWGYLVPTEFSSGARDAGEGIGIIGPIVYPVLGFFGAWLGWKRGLRKLQNRNAILDG